MKKIILSLMVLILSILLVGCSGVTPPSPDPPDDEVPIEILELIERYTGCKTVIRWPDGEILVYDATNYYKTPEILGELNRIIDGPVSFCLTDESDAEDIMIFGETYGDDCMVVGFSEAPICEFSFVEIDIDINNCNDNDIETYYRTGLLEAIGIWTWPLDSSDVLPAFSEEIKTVLFWLYKLEPGYQL